jgi:hypothetical protein
MLDPGASRKWICSWPAVKEHLQASGLASVRVPGPWNQVEHQKLTLTMTRSGTSRASRRPRRPRFNHACHSRSIPVASGMAARRASANAGETRIGRRPCRC